MVETVTCHGVKEAIETDYKLLWGTMKRKVHFPNFDEICFILPVVTSYFFLRIHFPWADARETQWGCVWWSNCLSSNIHAKIELQAPRGRRVIWGMVKLWTEPMLLLWVRFRDKGWGKQLCCLFKRVKVWHLAPWQLQNKMPLWRWWSNLPIHQSPRDFNCGISQSCEANISLLVNKPFSSWTKTKRSHYHLVIFLFMITTGETWTKYRSVSIWNFF